MSQQIAVTTPLHSNTAKGPYLDFGELEAETLPSYETNGEVVLHGFQDLVETLKRNRTS